MPHRDSWREWIFNRRPQHKKKIHRCRTRPAVLQFIHRRSWSCIQCHEKTSLSHYLRSPYLLDTGFLQPFQSHTGKWRRNQHPRLRTERTAQKNNRRKRITYWRMLDNLPLWHWRQRCGRWTFQESPRNGYQPTGTNIDRVWRCKDNL